MRGNFIIKYVRGIILCVGGILIALGGVANAKPAVQKPMFKSQIIFKTSSRGYTSIRIPCILALPDNTVIAIASGRSAVSDWGTIHMIMRRSTDGGKTWEPMRVLVDNGENNVADNPVLIWDDVTKTVHFVYQLNYERVFHMTSADSGATFSEPVDITPQLGGFAKHFKWNVIAPGPGHGIQLKNGRLLIPSWIANGKVRADGTRAHAPSVATSIYSDDHGKTWHCGDILPQTFKNMNETTAVTMDNGSVMFIIRSGNFFEALALSPDGVTNWTNAVLHKDLYTPICFASSLRISGAPDKSRILFCNPDSRKNPKKNVGNDWRARENLTVRLSYDDGRTWPVHKVIEPGASSYSDLAILSDGTVLCLYENDNQYISVARFNLEWLTGKKDSLQK